MSEWTHAICYKCWREREPGREPIRVTEPEDEACCYCGGVASAGIYRRDDPKKMNCRHEDLDT